MAKVAENQERAEKARTAYLYKQRIVVTSRRTNGKLMCEEKTDYQILPSGTGIQKEQTRFEGKLWHKHSYITYISEKDEKSATKFTPNDVSIQTLTTRSTLVWSETFATISPMTRPRMASVKTSFRSPRNSKSSINSNSWDGNNSVRHRLQPVGVTAMSIAFAFVRKTGTT